MTSRYSTLVAAVACVSTLAACAGSEQLPQTARPAAAAATRPLAVRIKEYKIPRAGGAPYYITAGPSDHNIWFTQTYALGEINMLGRVREHPLPKGTYPNGITVGSDHHLWFTSNHKYARVARWQRKGATYYPARSTCCLGNIVNGPDGALWFPGVTYYRQTLEFDIIGRVTTTGSVNTFLISGSSSSSMYPRPTTIAAGSDGALWFAECGESSIGRITTSGTVTNTYAIPSGAAPYDIIGGPDGALWFTESGNSIGRIDTTGKITEYGGLSGTGIGITVGPDGALWFTETNNKIGRMTTSGSVSEYPIPSAGSQPYFITSDPAGSLWFTEHHAYKIGRILLN